MKLEGKKVVIVGAGHSGVAAARLLAKKGAKVTISDQKRTEALPALALPGVALELGGHRAESFLDADLIVLSPGVPPGLPVIDAARQRGVTVTGEVELASRFIEAPIVAITGTNGKSTVTSLCGAIAQATGRPCFVGGNLGTPLSEAVGSDAARSDGLVICEVSSFQLETCETFHPRAAVLLNITPDHLDRYPTMRAYADAKMRVARPLGRGDLFVVNQDDVGCQEAVGRHFVGGCLTLGYSTRGRPPLQWLQSSSGDGVVTVELGGFIDGESLVVRLLGRAGAIEEERYPSGELPLVGRHNLGNALAAFLAMRGAALATPAQVLDGARAFRPLPHRMEFVGERGGVRYYDDSKGTNVAAVVASIDGFPRPFLLIAGGRDKGGSYAPLREALERNHARGVVVLGEAADKIASAVEGVAPIHRAGTMSEAVRVAALLASDGDAVILSPACSSYDMFRDYAERGEAFRRAVEKLG